MDVQAGVPGPAGAVEEGGADEPVAWFYGVPGVTAADEAGVVGEVALGFGLAGVERGGDGGAVLG